IAHRIVEVEHDLLTVAAPGHADDVVNLHFAAGAHTKIALDAGVEIDRHGRMAAVGVGRVALSEAAGGNAHAVGPGPEFRLRIVRGLALGLVGNQQLEHHLPRGLGALGGGFDFHAFGRLANAARGQHALALDLHHAGAAIAVGAVAGLGRIAQMRDVGAVALGHLPDGLALERLDLLAVEDDFPRLAGAFAWGHRFQPSVTRFPAVSTTLPENTLAHTAADSEPPGQGRKWKRRAWRSTVRSRGPNPTGPAP